jgi:hypothetical protein
MFFSADMAAPPKAEATTINPSTHVLLRFVMAALRPR